MKLLLRLWLLNTFLISVCPLTAQVYVQADFDQLPFHQMVERIEQNHTVRFFYQQKWVDSLRVDIQQNEIELRELLDQILRDTDLHYLITPNKDVILSKGHVISTPLGEDFWKGNGTGYALDVSMYLPTQISTESETIISDENQLIEIGESGSTDKSTATIAGYVRTELSGEPMVSVSVSAKDIAGGTLTNEYGYYVLTLPLGNHQLTFQYAGKQNTSVNIQLKGDGKLDIEMEEEVLALDEIVITGEKSQVESVQTGAARLSIDEIKSIPTLLGEADVMKIGLSLPGVQSVGEGTSGFHVRGGTNDQNLIMLNGAPLYNPSHLFGFFSAFNPNVIKHADLIKSGIQARYGGRVSSVMDVATRDGNKKKFITAAGIGPVTSKVSLEGPMLNKKGSYIAGFRSTYANWLLKALDNHALKNSRAFFGDGIGKASLQLNNNNFISASGYISSDMFRLNGDSLYTYQNANGSLSWRHVFSNHFSVKTTAGMTKYAYGLRSDQSPGNAFSLDYQVNQSYLNIDFDLLPGTKHNIHFGWQNNYYDLSPGQIKAIGDSSFVQSVALDEERGLESALYLGDEWTINPRFSLYAGIRFSGYAMLGAGSVFSYQPDLPKEPDFIIDTLNYSAGEIITRYGGPEYRLGGRVKLSESFSTKFSYDKTRQYIHMLTNTIAVSPTDTWRLSNPHIRPQIGDQWALGFYKEFQRKGYEITVEGYYKNLQNILEYKDGANLLVNETLEADVISASGKSYGVEFLLKKKTGQFNGWISYTWSRTKIKADSPFPSERINRGEYYPANYDIPHNLSIITNYKYNRRFSISFNLTYRTGRPTTLPVLQYELRDNVLAFFSDRNQFRVPDYFRADVSINLEGNHKIQKRGHSSWSLSFYNVTGRKNAYSVFPRATDGNIGIYRLAIFGTVIPTLVYNFELR